MIKSICSLLIFYSLALSLNHLLDKLLMILRRLLKAVLSVFLHRAALLRVGRLPKVAVVVHVTHGAVVHVDLTSFWIVVEAVKLGPR